MREVSPRLVFARRSVVLPVAVVLLGLVAILDHRYGVRLPISHLYYVPIGLAAAYFGYVGGLTAAVAAIGLFQFTHFTLPGTPLYLTEADVLRFILFVGAGLGVARFLDDRRRLVKLAQALRARNAKLGGLNTHLEEQNKAKTDLVGIAAHELKSPLAVIVGASEFLLTRDRLQPEQSTHFLSLILDGSRRLNRAIDNFLDLALLEAGRLNLRREEVALGRLLEDCRRFYCPGLDGRVQWPEASLDQIPLWVDRDRFLHALANLVSNAAKYSPPTSHIRVTAEAKGAYMHVGVSDEGQGIAAEDLGRIFERYYRCPDGRLSVTKGSGLGLSVSRDIVRAHGGEITVHSKVGKGSTFIISLPRDADRDHRDSAPAATRSILSSSPQTRPRETKYPDLAPLGAERR